MPGLEDVTYNREECIAAIRHYYHFLTKLYLEAVRNALQERYPGEFK